MKKRFWSGWAVAGVLALVALGIWFLALQAAQVRAVTPLAADFTLVVHPRERTTVPGWSTAYTVLITATDGFSEPVCLAVSGVPSDAQATFTVNPMTPTGLSMLLITTTAATPLGDYGMTITGTAGTLSHTVPVTLTIVAPRRVYLPLVMRHYTKLMADFTFLPPKGIVNVPLQFFDHSTGGPTAWLWDFGDESPPATVQYPAHVYTRTGDFTVTLTVNNTYEHDVATKSLTVVSPFGVNLLRNGGFEENWAWEFGDTPIPGAYDDIVAHSGLRSARLGIVPPAADREGYSSVYQQVTIPATTPGPVTLTFWCWPQREGVAEGVSRDIRQALQSWPDSIPQDKQYVLILDKDMNILEVLMATGEPLHTPDWGFAYFDISAYRGQTICVYFSVYNDGDLEEGRRTWMYVDDVAVMAGFPPTAGFTRAPTGTVPVSTPVVFTNTSTGTLPLAFHWDFGDGSDIVTETHPIHTYVETGTFTVTLTVESGFGNDRASDVVTVEIPPVPQLPTASFERVPTGTVWVNSVLTFTNTSTGTPPLVFRWNFGDESTPLTATHVTHTYAVSGTFMVTLAVSNVWGGDVATEPVTVVDHRETELITNGGFETDEAWEFGSTPIPAGYTDAQARGGVRSLRLGITSPLSDCASYSSAFQLLQVPITATEVTLTFWYLPKFQGGDRPEGSRALTASPVGESLETWYASPAAAEDRQYAMILDSDRNILEVLMAVTDSAVNWLPASFDLSAYRGQTIYVYFDVYNNGDGLPTWMFVDDVSVTATETPGLGVHWIGVDLSEQRLYAYEGSSVVRNILVSTGLPATPTPVGHSTSTPSIATTIWPAPATTCPMCPT